MRLVFNLFFFLGVSIAWVPSAVAAKTLTAVVGAPFIELQLFPGRGYPKFHAVEKNEKVHILKSRAGWYELETEEGKVGWVHRRNLVHMYGEDGLLIDFSLPQWHETDNPWHIALLGGAFDNTGAYNVLLGYRFTRHISAELKYTQAFGEFSTIKHASVALVHQMYPNWRYSPFFTLGTGSVKTAPDAILVEAEDQQDSALTVGAGLLVHINYKIAARFEYNKHTILTTQESNHEVEEWKAGLSVKF